jgi:uncharacterized membrane protein
LPVAMTLGLVLFSFYITTIYQKLYAEEKISALVPYQNLGSVISIVLGFFLFRDTSLASLGIAIIATAVIVLFSLDFRTFEFPRNFKLIVWVGILSVVRSLVTVYVLKEISANSYYAINTFLAAGLLLIPMFATGKAFKSPWKLGNRQFYYNRMMASFIGGVGGLVTIFLLQDLGLALATLLSFITVAVDLALSYLMMGDVPSKKDLALSVTITALVGLGMYFRA